MLTRRGWAVLIALTLAVSGLGAVTGARAARADTPAPPGTPVVAQTPRLDQVFSPASLPAGGVSTLTFTVTNTAALAAVNGWSFSESLPTGLRVADGSAATTCPSGTVSASVGIQAVTVTGSLAVGMASCTATVHVTSVAPGTYNLDAVNISISGLLPPIAPACVVFTIGLTVPSPPLVSVPPTLPGRPTVPSRPATPATSDTLALTAALSTDRFSSADQFTVALHAGNAAGPVMNPTAASTSTGTGATVAGGTGTTSATSVTPGTTYLLTEVGAAGTNMFDYTSTITCTDANGVQPGLPNGAAYNGSQPITPVAGSAISCVVANIAKGPGATVTVADVQGNNPAKRGDTLTYTVTVTNGGSTPVSNATAHDIVPVYTAFVPGSITATDSAGAATSVPDATGFVDGRIQVSLGTIAAGETRKVGFQVRVASTAGGGSLISDGETTQWTTASDVCVTSLPANAKTTVATPANEVPLVLRSEVGVVTSADFARLCKPVVAPNPAVLEFKLFHDVDILSGTTLVEYDPRSDVLSWRGHVAGSTSGVATASISAACTPGDEPTVSGAFYTDDKMYSMVAAGPGQVVVNELNGAVGEGMGAIPVGGTVAADPVQVAAGPTTPTITVLALYTPKARDVMGGDSNAVSQIQSSEGLMNAALSNSGVNARFHIIGIQRADGYTGSDDNSGIGAFQAGTDGANGPALRDQASADIATLYVAGGTGVGYMPIPPGSDTSSYGFSQVNIQYLPYEEASHEWGHNLGANHDLKNSSADSLNPNYPYNHGYTPPSQSWRTIMAYPDICNNCSTAPYFSSPLNYYKGEVTGNASGADNVRMMNQGAPVVAGYRPDVSQPTLFSLSVATSPNNGGTATLNAGGLFTLGTVVTVTEWPASGFTFAGWTLDGQPFDGTSQSAAVTITGNRSITANFVPANPTNTSAPPVGVSSFSGSGRADIIAHGTDGNLRILRNMGFSTSAFGVTWGSAAVIGSGWAGWPGWAMYYADLRGTGRKDLIVKGGDGNLYVFYNQGFNLSANTVTWSARTQIGSGWGGVNATDLFFAQVSGSGRADILRRGGDGNLYLYQNGGVSSAGVVNWSAATTVGSGWGGIQGADMFLAAVSGSGRTDLIVRGTDGYLYRFPNNGVNTGGVINWGNTVRVGSGWAGIAGTSIHFPDLSATGFADLVVKGADGSLTSYHNQGLNADGTVKWSAGVRIGSGWSGVADTDLTFS